MSSEHDLPEEETPAHQKPTVELPKVVVSDGDVVAPPVELEPQVSDLAGLEAREAREQEKQALEAARAQVQAEEAEQREMSKQKAEATALPLLEEQRAIEERNAEERANRPKTRNNDKGQIMDPAPKKKADE